MSGPATAANISLPPANLAPSLEDSARNRHFGTAIGIATSPAPSGRDEFEERFSHKLGGFRMSHGDRDARSRAIYLAACLATDDEQRTEARRQAYVLLGLGGSSDYWPTRALQRLGPSLKDDMGFLLGSGWALRSLAAILWAEHGGPSYVGARLAGDDDVRVRRAFAEALAGAEQSESHDAVRGRLALDPCYSVRAAIHGIACPKS